MRAVFQKGAPVLFAETLREPKNADEIVSAPAGIDAKTVFSLACKGLDYFMRCSVAPTATMKLKFLFRYSRASCVAWPRPV
jgi:hypothetical protein